MPSSPHFTSYRCSPSGEPGLLETVSKPNGVVASIEDDDRRPEEWITDDLEQWG